MLVLGVDNSKQIKNDFIKKLEDKREDAKEYEFGEIKGETLLTDVKHTVCGKTFESRPYIFLMDKWPKKCPYCHTVKINELTEDDIRARVERVSNGHLSLIGTETIYYDIQKSHKVELKCNDCGNEFKRVFALVKEGFTCPKCKNK